MHRSRRTSILPRLCPPQPQRLHAWLFCLARTVIMCRVFSRAHCSPLVQILKRQRCPKIDRLGNLLWDGAFSSAACSVEVLALQFLYCPFVGGAFDQKIRPPELRTILPRGHGGGICCTSCCTVPRVSMISG